MPLAQYDSRFSFLALKSRSINHKRINKNGNSNEKCRICAIYTFISLPPQKSTTLFHVCFLAEAAK